MSKKLFCFFAVLFLCFLSACADPPGPELSSLPENYFLEKSKEERGIERLPDERENLEFESFSPSYSSGNFLLLEYLPSKLFKVSVFLEHTEICSWKDEVSDPRNFQMLQNELYFTNENCPGIGEKIIVWDVPRNYATFEEDGLVELFIIVRVGSQDFYLEKIK